MRLGRAHQAIATIATGVMDGHDLGILRKRVIDLKVSRLDLPTQMIVVEQLIARQFVHAGNEFPQIIAHDEILPALFERLHRGGIAFADGAFDHLAPTLACYVWSLLRPRQGEFTTDDLLVEDKPAVVVAAAAQIFERAERVET